MFKKSLFFLLLLVISSPSWALNKMGRLGVGMSNQLVTEAPALSIKIQQSRTFALGGLLSFRSDEDEGTTYGAGVKLYRNLFAEPLLDFYMALTLATLGYEENGKNKSGYQVDGTLGSEFHFEGIESLGFSFEFGFSANKGPNGRRIETLGQNFLKAALHFYL